MDSQTYSKYMMCRAIFAISNAERNLDSYMEKYNATLNINVKT